MNENDIKALVDLLDKGASITINDRIINSEADLMMIIRPSNQREGHDEYIYRQR